MMSLMCLEELAHVYPDNAFPSLLEAHVSGFCPSQLFLAFLHAKHASSRSTTAEASGSEYTARPPAPF